MFAALLKNLASPQKAWAVASLWLLCVTVIDVQTAGAYRSTILFAVPVAVVSWTDWKLGFIFAALGVLAAKFCGALPEPGSLAPLWLDAMIAFMKLSIDAAVINAWGRRYRRRLTAQAGNPDRARDQQD